MVHILSFDSSAAEAFGGIRGELERAGSEYRRHSSDQQPHSSCRQCPPLRQDSWAAGGELDLTPRFIVPLERRHGTKQKSNQDSGGPAFYLRTYPDWLSG